jgi:hypothetical protein
VGEVVGFGATAAIGVGTGALVLATTVVAGALGATLFLGVKVFLAAAALPPAGAPDRTVLVGTLPAIGGAAALAGATLAAGGTMTVRTT